MTWDNGAHLWKTRGEHPAFCYAFAQNYQTIQYFRHDPPGTKAVDLFDTYHPVLSNFSFSTPDIGVDGYFTSSPENATILLRRTANGQATMIMYDYGQGKAIVTSMYSDWAFGHSHASAEEIALVADLIFLAKK